VGVCAVRDQTGCLCLGVVGGPDKGTPQKYPKRSLVKIKFTYKNRSFD